MFVKLNCNVVYFSPRVEELEKRENPATFNPMNVTELMAAFETANINNEADVIDLGGQTFTLATVENNSNGLPVVEVDSGNIANTLTVQNGILERAEGGSTPLFRILRAEGPLTLINVTLRNGRVLNQDGGGIFISGSDATVNIIESRIEQNTSIKEHDGGAGGGIFVRDGGTLHLSKSIVEGNEATEEGGGIFIGQHGLASIVKSGIVGNIAGAGGGIRNRGTILEFRDSVLSGNSADSAPEFSQLGVVLQSINTVIGQGSQPITEIDVAHEVPEPTEDEQEREEEPEAQVQTVELYAVGTDPGPEDFVESLVKVYKTDQTLRFTLKPFEDAFQGGVRVATADVNGDGTEDIITGAGPGGGPRVRVFNGQNGRPLQGSLGSFFAFDESFRGGIFVSAGDVNNDGRADVIVSQDGVENASIRVFDAATGTRLSDFMTEQPTLGVRVAAGDVDGDGQVDIIAGAGSSGPARVTIFNALTGRVKATSLPFANFTGGIYVSAGDTNGDGVDEVIVGTGSQRQTRIEIFDFQQSVENSQSTLVAFRDIVDRPGEGTSLEGVRVGVTDLNGDGRDEIIAGRGPSDQPLVQIFNRQNGNQTIASFDPFAEVFNRGLYVG